MFESLLTELEQREQNRRVEEVVLNTLAQGWEVVSAGGEQRIKVGDRLLTKSAFVHMCSLINPKLAHNVSARYLWSYPDAVEVMMPIHMQRFLEDSDDDQTVRMLMHGDAATAVFSSKYVDYSNYKLVKEFSDHCIENDLEPKAYTYKAFDPYFDSMQFVPVFENFDAPTTVYGAGIMISNSENKTRSLMFAPVVKSTICDNSIMAYGYHRGRHNAGIENFAEEMISESEALIRIAVAVHENYMDAMNVKVQNMELVIAYIAKQLRLSKALKTKLVEGITSERLDQSDTLFGLVSGLTYMANFMEQLNHEESMRILMYASELLKLTDKDILTVGDIALWD